MPRRGLPLRQAGRAPSAASGFVPHRLGGSSTWSPGPTGHDQCQGAKHDTKPFTVGPSTCQISFRKLPRVRSLNPQRSPPGGTITVPVSYTRTPHGGRRGPRPGRGAMGALWASAIGPSTRSQDRAGAAPGGGRSLLTRTLHAQAEPQPWEVGGPGRRLCEGHGAGGGGQVLAHSCSRAPAAAEVPALEMASCPPCPSLPGPPGRHAAEAAASPAGGALSVQGLLEGDLSGRPSLPVTVARPCAGIRALPRPERAPRAEPAQGRAP